MENSAALLPLSLSSFVGREAELREIASLVACHRLVTVTGSGGCGKTRLALRAAESLVARFPEGIRFVDLSSVAEPALVPNSVAQAFAVSEEPQRSLVDSLVDFFRS